MGDEKYLFGGETLDGTSASDIPQGFIREASPSDPFGADYPFDPFFTPQSAGFLSRPNGEER